MKLRRGGLTWDAIAQRVGYADPSGAQKTYARAASRVLAEDVDAIRKLESERLDLAQAAIWGDVLKADIPAVNTLIRIMERRAKLLGLDQPTRIQAEVVNYDGDSIRARLAEIIAATDRGGSDSSQALSMGEAAGASESDTY